MKNDIHPCSQCGKAGAGDCSRVQCARRRQVTAQLAGGSQQMVAFASGTYRRAPTKQGNQS